MGLFRLFVWCSVLLVLSLCLVVDARLGCKSGFGCLHPEASIPESGSIKVSGMWKEVFKGFRPLNHGDGGNQVGWDLRKAPSGPDPLHHNDGPKKPQTP